MYSHILLVISVLPSILLMIFIYRMDKIEKEPKSLLAKLFFAGLGTIISAVILEMAGGWILDRFLPSSSLLYMIIENFFIVAFAEEGGKYFVLKKMTWKHREFDHKFDAIVYAVFVSLGFATLENIMYVFENGVGVGLMRAVLSVPGHAIFSVFMGYFFGLAKEQEVIFGNEAKKKKYLFLSLAVPVFIHGFYDFCLTCNNTLMILVFLVFMVVIYITAFIRVRTASKNDRMLVNQHISMPFFGFSRGTEPVVYCVKCGTPCKYNSFYCHCCGTALRKWRVEDHYGR